MAIKLFDAVGFISVNAKALEKGMSKARRFVNKGMVGIGKLIKTGAKVAAVALAAIGAAATLVGVKILKMGADAEESENLFEVSLGSMADAARAWSIELSQTLGLNQFEVRKTIGVFNQMFVSMGVGTQKAFEMSKGLTELAADMASFFNIAQEEAFQKLQAGITGEIEPLKRLGIVLTVAALDSFALAQGLGKTTLQMTEAEKVALRYAFILEQTAKAQGDLARTADSVTNRFRAIKNAIAEVATNIGISVQPALKNLLGSVSGFVERVKVFVSENAELFELIFGVLGRIVEKIARALLPSFENFEAVAEDVLATVLNLLLDVEDWLDGDGKQAVLSFAKLWDLFWDAMLFAAKQAWKGIKAASKAAWTALKFLMAEAMVGFKSAWEITWNGIGRFFGAVMGGIKTALINMVNFSIRNLNSLIDKINTLLALLDRIPGVGNLQIPNIPTLSTGNSGSTGRVTQTIQRVDINVQGGENSQVIGNAVAAALLDLGQGNLFSRGGIAVTP